MGSRNRCRDGLILAGLAGAAVAFALGHAAAWAQSPKSGEQVYREVCFACHETGVAGAPKFGDRKAWAPLIKEGQHVLSAHAWVGVRGMPAKGGREDLTLEEFSRGVAHMARAGGGAWTDPDEGMLKRINHEVKKRIEHQQKGKK